MVKLMKLKKGATPPLLPSPPVSLGSNQPPYQNITSSPSLNASTLAHLLKLEVSLFADENTLSWLFQIQHLFMYHHIPPEQKIDIAAFYVTSNALQWYQWLFSIHQLTTWEDFTCQVKLQFGPPKFVNHKANYLSSNKFPLQQFICQSLNDYLGGFVDLALVVC